MVRIITGTENQIDELEANRIRKECAEVERGRSVAGRECLKGVASTSIEQRVAQLEKDLAELRERFESHTHRLGEGRGITT